MEINVITHLVSEAKSDNYEYEDAYGEKQVVKSKGLFLMTEDGIFLGSLSPDIINLKVGDTVVEHAIRWRSRRSGFIIMDGNSERIKDRNSFWIDVKNPLTNRFE